MPHYRFQIVGQRQSAEAVIVELADDAAAKRLAMMSLGEELQDADPAFWAEQSWQLIVTNATDEPVCSIAVTGTSGASD